MARTNSSKAAQAKELCRQLKPVIGKQADRIWQAFVAENSTGKDQIIEYLELLAAKHFHGALDDDGPTLLPPDRQEAEGEYSLGTVTYNGKLLHPFGLREGEFIQHTGIFGRSGAGKTNLGFLLVQKLIERGKPVIIFDWKKNFRDMINMPGFEDVAVYTVGHSTSPLKFNPLIPPPGTNPKTWLKKLISVVAHAYLLGNGVFSVFQKTIDQVYRDAGVYDGSVDRWPTFRDVLDALHNKQMSGREAGWATSALRALSSLCFGEMDTLVNQGHQDLSTLFKRPVILELDALTQSDKVFFVQALLLWIHHQRLAAPVRERFELAVMIEEAHQILSGERRSLLGGQSVMELTFREIRELGVGLILADQLPSQISTPALANTYTTICFNLKHRSDVGAMNQAMLLKDDQKDLLGRLKLGEAIVRLQGRGKGPFTIHVPEFKINKGSVTDVDVRYRMSQLGLLSVRKQSIEKRPPSHQHLSRDMLTPGQQHLDAESEPAHPDRYDASPAAMTVQNSDLTRARAFLKDVQRYPDNGVAERYKRLGLSVRQGQKIKNQLVDDGLIMEQVQTTRIGKLRVIRLTEQAELELSEHGDSHTESE